MSLDHPGNGMNLLTLREILQRPEVHMGWLYMRPTAWTLDSMGFFYDADLDLPPEEEMAARALFEADGWVISLSSEDIEDVIANMRDQLEAPGDAELLLAIRYFYDHDAFMEWPECE